MGLLSGRRRLDGSDAPRGSRGSPGPSYWGISGPGDLVPPRPYLQPNRPVVTNDTALRHSAVWAALRLRAGLISTLPVDVFRMVNGIQVEAVKPPVLLAPGGPEVDWPEWCYSTQFDIDRAGNTVGIITAVDGYGLPACIELQDINTVTVKVKDNRIAKFKIGNKLYDPGVIWHEKAYTVAGMHVGLSPVAYARWAIGEYLTVEEFATNWYSSGAVPKSRLQNKAKVLSATEINTVKEAWRAALASDEPFVHGSDWEYEMIQATAASNDWLEAKKFSVTDICRFLDVPADLIDSTPTGQTRAYQYANITQKNLQLLIMHLGPAMIRRETRLSNRLLPAPRFMKFNGDALLRLDPLSRAQVIWQQIVSRTLPPSEARALENRPPLTAEQIAEFDHFWPPPGQPQGGSPPGYSPGGDVPVPEGDLVPPIEELSAASIGGQLATLRYLRAIESGALADPGRERAHLNGRR